MKNIEVPKSAPQEGDEVITERVDVLQSIDDERAKLASTLETKETTIPEELKESGSIIEATRDLIAMGMDPEERGRIIQEMFNSNGLRKEEEQVG
tara:strand:+ start:1144 stop:1428 length:285 start_codon:yes stop_codon:yes gene_type:complete